MFVYGMFPWLSEDDDILEKEKFAMKKRIITLVAMFAIMTATLLMAGCGGNKEAADWDYVKKNGKFIIGLDDTFAPMGFRDKNNKLVGFDIDLAKAVGKELGVEVEFKPIDWDAKYSELKAKNIDCVWNGMSANPERAEKLSLSKLYLNNKIVVMTMKNDVKVNKASDLKQYKIGTQADSAALETMRKNKEYKNFKKNITEYKTYDEAILDLKAGRLDVIAVDQVLGNYKKTKMKNILKVCKFDFGDDHYAIGFRKNDKKLTEKVNEALKALIDNGKAGKISKKWFGKNIVEYKDYEGK